MGGIHNLVMSNATSLQIQIIIKLVLIITRSCIFNKCYILGLIFPCFRKIYVSIMFRPLSKHFFPNHIFLVLKNGQDLNLCLMEWKVWSNIIWFLGVYLDSDVQNETKITQKNIFEGTNIPIYWKWQWNKRQKLK